MTKNTTDQPDLITVPSEPFANSELVARHLRAWREAMEKEIANEQQPNH